MPKPFLQIAGQTGAELRLTSPRCECLPLAAGLCAVTAAAAVHVQFCWHDITLCISQIGDFLFDELGRENELNVFF